MNDYQLFVIGAGPAGYHAALRAAQSGLKTAIVDYRELGGTCVNRGCVPAKTLLHASGIYQSAAEAGKIGIHTENTSINMQELFAYKRQVAQTLSDGVESMLKKAKVSVLKGKARIPERHTVDVDMGDETVRYTADSILIATGSAPARPPIPGLDLPGVMTSDELLEGTDHLYRSIAIIGGGVIGVEFAEFYLELGCDVTIIEGLDHLLPALDKELGQSLALSMKKRGARIHVHSMVEKVEKAADQLIVTFASKGEQMTAGAEAVLCAIGRVPYYDGLFSNHVRPKTDGRLLQVNERFETSEEGIYAVGDVSSRTQLAHAAAAQGIACVDMLCGRSNETNLALIPSCIYSRPEIASVGLTEAEAKKAGIPTKTGKCVLGGNARTLISDPGRCFMKVVANADTQEILGAQLMCMNSTDMISEISAAIANHLTAPQLLSFIRPHPTFEEALSEALSKL